MNQPPRASASTSIQQRSPARANAETRGVQDRLRLQCEDATGWSDDTDVAIVIGASHAWGGTPETCAPFGPCYGQADGSCWERASGNNHQHHKLLRRSTREPDDFTTLPGLVDLCLQCGYRLLALSTATLNEWDHFESALRRGRERWLLENPDAPNATDVRTEIDTHRNGWLHGTEGSSASRTSHSPPDSLTNTRSPIAPASEPPRPCWRLAGWVIGVATGRQICRSGLSVEAGIGHHPFAMVKKWDLIYELRRTRNTSVRCKSRPRTAAGSRPPRSLREQAVVGGDRFGLHRARSMEGTITEAKPTSMPDRQEFRMRTADGSELRVSATAIPRVTWRGYAFDLST